MQKVSALCNRHNMALAVHFMHSLIQQQSKFNFSFIIQTLYTKDVPDRINISNLFFLGFFSLTLLFIYFLNTYFWSTHGIWQTDNSLMTMRLINIIDIRYLDRGIISVLARGAMVLQIKLREGVIKKKKERERETSVFSNNS